MCLIIQTQHGDFINATLTRRALFEISELLLSLRPKITMLFYLDFDERSVLCGSKAPQSISCLCLRDAMFLHDNCFPHTQTNTPYSLQLQTNHFIQTVESILCLDKSNKTLFKSLQTLFTGT